MHKSIIIGKMKDVNGVKVKEIPLNRNIHMSSFQVSIKNAPFRRKANTTITNHTLPHQAVTEGHHDPIHPRLIHHSPGLLRDHRRVTEQQFNQSLAGVALLPCILAFPGPRLPVFFHQILLLPVPSVQSLPLYV
jgi:hypothetical protein